MIKHLADTGFVLFSWFSVLLVLGAAMALVFFLLYHGFHTISPKLFFGTTQWWPALIGTKPVFDGIWPAMAGTLFLVMLSAGMAIPVGVAAGIYLSEYASDKMRAFSTFAVDLLAGIPSIVMGLFGFSMIIVLHRIFVPEAKTCIFLAAVCIAMLILPYMVRTTMNALSGIPENLRLIGPGLGLTQWQNIRFILLPVSGRGPFFYGILASKAPGKAMVRKMNSVKSDTTLVLDDISVSFAGKTILNHISISIGHGMMNMAVGPVRIGQDHPATCCESIKRGFPRMSHHGKG